MTYQIRRYTPDDAAQWNQFISGACNATFLFNRGFMDYHADRFSDFSLVIEEKGNWVAVLPAHRIDDVLHSHLGLTYGGLVYQKMHLGEMVTMMHDMLQFLEREGVKSLRIKTIPSIYHQRPAEELHYAMFLAKAELFRRDALSVVDLTAPSAITRRRRACARRGQENGLMIREDGNFKDFWKQILIPNLQKKHNVKPVHTVDEIALLHSRFPENIRHFNVYDGARLVAGTTVFVSDRVAHPQYVSGQEEKNALGSLDYLYYHLITEVFTDIHFFDFGISNEDNGRKLNGGLAFWKESFGAGTVVQDFYAVDTANYIHLENVLI